MKFTHAYQGNLGFEASQTAPGYEDERLFPGEKLYQPYYENGDSPQMWSAVVRLMLDRKEEQRRRQKEVYQRKVKIGKKYY